MTSLDRLLQIDVETYLFNDLAEMQREDVRVAFPLLMAACAGIELLGQLTAPGPQKNPGTERSFLWYWKEYLYKDDSQKADLGLAIYTLVRNGLGHTFLLKGPIAVARHEVRDHHLKWMSSDSASDQRLYIDASQLADDLRTSYYTRFRARVDASDSEEPNRRTMQMRLDCLTERYAKEAAKYRPKTPKYHIVDRPNVSQTTVSTTAVFIYPPTPGKSKR